MITPEILSRIINELAPYITQIAIHYMDRDGCVKIKVNKGYNLDTTSMRFVPGPFNKNEHIYLGDAEYNFTDGFEPYEAIAVYYSIFGKISRGGCILKM